MAEIVSSEERLERLNRVEANSLIYQWEFGV